MQKSGFFLPVISVLLFFFMAQFGAGQEGGGCTPQFAIYSADMFEAVVGSTIEIDVAVKNTGTCAGSTVVIAEVPEGWNKTKIATGSLQPGQNYISSIEITLPDDAKSTIVSLIAPGAEVSPVKIIIGGMEPEENPVEENASQAAQQPGQESPPIAPAPGPAPISVPQETQPSTEQQEEPGEAEPAQSQPESVSITGLLTANPAVQLVVFAIIIFGAGYLAGRMKREGFRYRFRR